MKENSLPVRKIHNMQKNMKFFVLLKGKYFLLRLYTGFASLLDLSFSFLPSLQHKLYRGTNLLFHSRGSYEYI